MSTQGDALDGATRAVQRMVAALDELVEAAARAAGRLGPSPVAASTPGPVAGRGEAATALGQAPTRTQAGPGPDSPGGAPFGGMWMGSEAPARVRQQVELARRMAPVLEWPGTAPPESDRERDEAEEAHGSKRLATAQRRCGTWQAGTRAAGHDGHGEGLGDLAAPMPSQRPSILGATRLPADRAARAAMPELVAGEHGGSYGWLPQAALPRARQGMAPGVRPGPGAAMAATSGRVVSESVLTHRVDPQTLTELTGRQRGEMEALLNRWMREARAGSAGV
jgi:hypothetical protein